MTTAADIRRCVEAAAQHASRGFPRDRDMRMRTFIAYLAGAISADHHDIATQKLSPVVEALLDDKPTPIGET